MDSVDGGVERGKGNGETRSEGGREGPEEEGGPRNEGVNILRLISTAARVGEAEVV